MAKKIQGFIRLQLPAGAANPAPPGGPALGGLPLALAKLADVGGNDPLAEVDHLVSARGGPTALRALRADLLAGAYLVEWWPAAIASTVNVAERYADTGLGLADASLVALAERLATIQIATLDDLLPGPAEEQRQKLLVLARIRERLTPAVLAMLRMTPLSCALKRGTTSFAAR